MSRRLTSINIILIIAFAWLCSFLITRGGLLLTIEIESPVESRLQIFYELSDNGYSEKDSTLAVLKKGRASYIFNIPWATTRLRIDPGSIPGEFKIFRLTASLPLISFSEANLSLPSLKAAHHLGATALENNNLHFTVTGTDPFFVYDNWRQMEWIFWLGSIGVSACLLMLLSWFYLNFLSRHPHRSATRSKNLLGPVISFVTLILCAGIAFIAYKVFVPKPPTQAVFQGGEGVYALSLVSTTGEKLSKQDGSLKLMLDPFTLYRFAPDQLTVSYSINEHRFRGKFNPERPNKVFVLGGSTAFGQGLPRDELCLNARLEQYDSSAHYVNAGVVGFLSGQELALMVHYLDDYNPAGYIVFDGWNEIFEQMVSLPREPGLFGFNSAFFVTEERLRKLYLTEVTQDQQSSAKSSAKAIDDAYFNNLVETYTNNLIKMHDFATSQGARFLVAFQPELGAKKKPTPSEQESLKSWDSQFGYLKSGLSEKYTRLLDLTIARLKEHQIQFINLNADLTLQSSAAELFYDAVHLNEAGTDLAAKAIVTELQRK